MNCAFYIVQDDCQNANHTNSLPYIEGNSLISLPVLPRVMCHLSRSYWRPRFVRSFYGGCPFGSLILWCSSWLNCYFHKVITCFLVIKIFSDCWNWWSCTFSQFVIYYMSKQHPPEFPTVWYFFNYLFISIILEYEL